MCQCVYEREIGIVATQIITVQKITLSSLAEGRVVKKLYLQKLYCQKIACVCTLDNKHLLVSGLYFPL